MRLILYIPVLLMSINTMAQSFEKRLGNTPDELIYQGKVTFADLNKESAFKWFAEGYGNYKPNAEEITFLKNELKQFDMVVLMGTWCEDSHNMIPKLYRVLRDTDFPLNKFVMYGLDRNKIGLHHEEEQYKVTSVPTVILYSAGQEAGRITELVQKSVEADLANIIREYNEE